MRFPILTLSLCVCIAASPIPNTISGGSPSAFSETRPFIKSAERQPAGMPPPRDYTDQVNIVDELWTAVQFVNVVTTDAGGDPNVAIRQGRLNK
ncbi:hypothetical protein DFH06DRAFT_1323900 [Mycena polygramma]|nr:hypothetical protein DFH06DRAFT_1323900 [Mycena polygramma]